MKLKINPTRQELLKLKKRLKTARLGHKLLEDKLESLMQEFLKRIKLIKGLRKDLENKIPQVFFNFLWAQDLTGPKEINLLISHFPSALLETKEKNIMGVVIQEYRVANKEEILKSSLGSLSANSLLQKTYEMLHGLFDNLINYSLLEQELRSLASEIEQTRRRVNALEYMFIPEMERVKKYISQKLEENERFSRSTLMKLKTQLSL